MLRCDPSIDPTTGLLNLFGFMEATHTGALVTAGTIIVIDMGDLTAIDSRWGPETSDTCVRALAGLLQIQPRDTTTLFSSLMSFRLGDTVFIQVLPGHDIKQTEKRVADIQEAYRQLVLRHGVAADVDIAFLAYGDQGSSVGMLLQAAYRALEGHRQHDGPGSAFLPPWVERFADTTSKHVYETLQLLRQARTLALTDAISGLPNHRAVELYLEDMVRDFLEQGKPCSVLLVDGDNLRAYNELGYERGNQMIRDLSSVIAGTVRYGDRIARWLSGDEFIVLLPSADRRAAVKVAERIRAVVEIKTAGWPLPITVSVGVACCPSDGTTPSELLMCAEARNVAAKRAGKNQVL